MLEQLVQNSAHRPIGLGCGNRVAMCPPGLGNRCEKGKRAALRLRRGGGFGTLQTHIASSLFAVADAWFWMIFRSHLKLCCFVLKNRRDMTIRCGLASGWSWCSDFCGRRCEVGWNPHASFQLSNYRMGWLMVDGVACQVAIRKRMKLWDSWRLMWISQLSSTCQLSCYKIDGW